MSLSDHVGDLVSPVVFICFQLSSGVSKWQRNRETHTKFVNGPLWNEIEMVTNSVLGEKVWCRIFLWIRNGQYKLHLWRLQHNIQACLRSNSHTQFDLITNILDLSQAYSNFPGNAGNVLREPKNTWIEVEVIFKLLINVKLSVFRCTPAWKLCKLMFTSRMHERGPWPKCLIFSYITRKVTCSLL